PADNSIKNGATCPTCTSANSDYCYTSYTIECTGDEVWCLLQSTITSGLHSHHNNTILIWLTASVDSNGEKRNPNEWTRRSVMSKLKMWVT
ncbi:hypothetical protein FKM82_019820, partial [Ascaphus truei]